MSTFANDVKIPIDVANWTKHLHEIVHDKVEETLGREWRVTAIEQHSATKYEATKLTRQSDHPEYILSEVKATFEVTAIEDGALERKIDLYTDETVRIDKPRLHCMLYLMSDGLLMLRDSMIEVST